MSDLDDIREQARWDVEAMTVQQAMDALEQAVLDLVTVHDDPLCDLAVALELIRPGLAELTADQWEQVQRLAHTHYRMEAAAERMAVEAERGGLDPSPLLRLANVAALPGWQDCEDAIVLARRVVTRVEAAGEGVAGELRVSEAARILNVTSARVSRLCDEEKLESTGKGRKRRISAKSVADYQRARDHERL